MRAIVALLITLFLLLSSPVIANNEVQKALSKNEITAIVTQVINKLELHYLYPERIDELKNALNENLLTKWRAQSYLEDKFLYELRQATHAATGDSQITLTIAEHSGKLTNNLDETIITADILDNNIGYLSIEGDLTLPYNETSIKKSLAFVQGTQGLILDLREAEALSIEFTQLILAHFYAENTTLANLQLNNENVVLSSQKVNTQLKVPLVIITSAFVSGPWEFIAYSLQTNDKAIIIGQNTMGLNKFTKSVPISGRYELTLPFAKVLEPNGDDYFNQGVIPDHQSTSSNLKALALSFFED